LTAPRFLARPDGLDTPVRHRARKRSSPFAGPCQGGEASNRTTDALVGLLGTLEGQTLVNCFRRIPDPEIRRSFVALIEGVTALIESRPKPKRPRPKPKKK